MLGGDSVVEPLLTPLYQLPMPVLNTTAVKISSIDKTTYSFWSKVI